MTKEELFIKADAEMKVCYENSIKCMESANTYREVSFYRDYTQGEINGISSFAMSMYLTMIYDHDNKDIEKEEQKFIRFCERIREKTKELDKRLTDYKKRFL